VGSSIGDSDEFTTFQGALERVISSALQETYPWWRYESLDAFRFSAAFKLGREEAELIGLCLLMSDQSWTPLHVRMRVSAQSDSIEWLDCKLGESGNGAGGMVRTPYGSLRDAELLYAVTQRLASISWAYAVTRGSATRMRRELVEIDVSAVTTSEELQLLLLRSLDFPRGYGRNWNAFWDAITGLVEMPRRLQLVGWAGLAARLPDEARAMRKCLDRMATQYPEFAAQVEYA
jgi:ribonuclease inhibitor